LVVGRRHELAQRSRRIPNTFWLEGPPLQNRALSAS